MQLSVHSTGGQKADVVSQAVDWFMQDGVLAYKSLVSDHYDFVRDTLRSDLENDFANIRNRSIERVRSRFGDELTNKTLEGFKPVDDFIRSQFLEAGLGALTIHGEPSDIEFGRKYLTSTSISAQLAAVKIVCRFGAAGDSAELLKISKDGWGEVRDAAGLGPLRLSQEPFEIARDLVKSKSEKLVSAGFKWLYTQDSEEIRDLFGALLDSDRDVDRVRSVYYFYKKLSKSLLARLLTAQFDKRTYYYNVVTWLDRLLYASLPLRRAFVQQLEGQANPDLSETN